MELTTQQSEAIQQSATPLSLVDPKTAKVYVLVEESVHERAMAALQRQNDDCAAIQEGLDDMVAGRLMTLEESRARTEAALSAVKK